ILSRQFTLIQTQQFNLIHIKAPTMKIIPHLIRSLTLAQLILFNFIPSTPGQVVSIPDPGLNAAVRDALQIPSAPITAQDMLGLASLSAESRNIQSVAGLEAAHNLTFLDLDSNSLSNFVAPSALTNLKVISLSNNHLTNFALPSALSNLTVL